MKHEKTNENFPLLRYLQKVRAYSGYFVRLCFRVYQLVNCQNGF